jgi:hypothetical protein
MMLTASAHGYTATATLLPGKLAPIPFDPKPQLVAQEAATSKLGAVGNS